MSVGGQECIGRGSFRRGPAYQSAGDGLGQGPGVVVGLDVPVHGALESLGLYVIGLETDGRFVVIAQDHGAQGVYKVGNLGGVVPADAVLGSVEFDVPVVEALGGEVIVVAVAVEGDTQDNLVVGDARIVVERHRLVAAALGHGRLVQTGVVVRRLAHVVGHDVDEVQVVDATLEIHIFCAGRRCHGQEIVVAKGGAKVLEQQGEVLGVVGRSGDAGAVAGGVFPVQVYAVQIIRLDCIQTVLAEILAMGLAGRHFAEIAGSPTANREDDLQVGIGLLERRDLLKA